MKSSMGCFACVFNKKQKAKVHSNFKRSGHLTNGHNNHSNKWTDNVDTYGKGASIQSNTTANGSVNTGRITLETGAPKKVNNLNIGSKVMNSSDKNGKSVLNNGVNSKMLLAGTIASTIGSMSSTKLLATIADDNQAVDDDIYNNFDFPFMNLVFEGGGNKGMAYVGALKVLEEAGITRKIKGIAGASVGAITAALVAVGFTSSDLKEFMETDLRKVLVDHKCGYCSLLPNLLSGFGWNPGNKLLKWFGETLKDRTGNPDITFREVLQQYGHELCIVVTNLSQMSTEYFHPKTTPNTPIRTAVRMSTALPGVFQSVRYRLNEEITDVYVDGGLLCNYPIHAFDGWWLSMDPKDSFFKRLQPLENYAKLFSKGERFGVWNYRTLGIMLYSHTETELMKSMLAKRQGNEPPPPPNSKLYRKRRKLRICQAVATQEHQAVVSAVGRFMKELHLMHFDLDGIISLRELRKVFEVSTGFTADDQILLFGDADINEAFKELDTDDDGEITFQELMSFVEKKGVNIQTRFLGYTRKNIKTLGDFISTLQTALAINVKRNYVEERDIERTIGIDTDYIEASDFYLEDVDKTFLLESGARAARAFLRHFCKEHPEYRRRGSAMLSKDFFDSPRLKKKFETLLEDRGENDSSSAKEETVGLMKEDVAKKRENYLRTPELTRADIHLKTERNPEWQVSRRRSSDVSEISLVAFPFSQ